LSNQEKGVFEFGSSMVLQVPNSFWAGIENRIQIQKDVQK
jgi:hypothetical protein